MTKKRRILTPKAKRQKALEDKRAERLTVGNVVVQNVESFKRVLATNTPPSSGVKTYGKGGLDPYGFGFLPVVVGDEVTHALDTNNVVFEVVGFYCKTDAFVYGCKVKGKKTLWFPSNYLTVVPAERRPTTAYENLLHWLSHSTLDGEV